MRLVSDSAGVLDSKGYTCVQPVDRKPEAAAGEVVAPTHVEAPSEVGFTEICEDGSIEIVAGSLENDAGSIENDAGSIDIDAGSIEIDAGSIGIVAGGRDKVIWNRRGGSKEQMQQWGEEGKEMHGGRLFVTFLGYFPSIMCFWSTDWSRVVGNEWYNAGSGRVFDVERVGLVASVVL